jgi:opacity protein-like surface antigen
MERTHFMKILAAVALAVLLAAPAAFAADTAPQGGKPASSSNPTPTPSKSVGPHTDSMSTGASGTSTGTSGESKDMPGASDSKKPDNSLSTNGSTPKQ